MEGKRRASSPPDSVAKRQKTSEDRYPDMSLESIEKWLKTAEDQYPETGAEGGLAVTGPSRLWPRRLYAINEDRDTGGGGGGGGGGYEADRDAEGDGESDSGVELLPDDGDPHKRPGAAVEMRATAAAGGAEEAPVAAVRYEPMDVDWPEGC